MKVILVINIPTPYRVPVFNRVAEKFGDDFIVLFCAQMEPNREWDYEQLKFQHVFLKQNYSERNGVCIHNNIDVIKRIKDIKPDVLVTNGFNPTSIYSWVYAIITRTPHVTFTDGWIVSERNLGNAHKLVRKLVYKTSKAYIGAGKNSLILYKSYNIRERDMFISHLCSNNESFLEFDGNQERPYDVMFSGRIVAGKIPEFFVEVVERLILKRKKLSVLVIGNGPLREKFLNSLQSTGADLYYPGFIRQEDLPYYYTKAKVFLFTTICDAWGIVANEALASGTPVFTTPYAGVINDLVIDGYNGYIREVDSDAWASQVNVVLDDKVLLDKLSANAIKSIEGFNYDNAARGIIEAVEWAANKRPTMNEFIY